MANERVKLLADLLEAAENRKCTIPDDAIESIMNDTINRKIFKTDPYKRAKVLRGYAEKLINQRKKLY
jgi:hypothetical protein